MWRGADISQKQGGKLLNFSSIDSYNFPSHCAQV